jgi:hypothetical protein
MSTKGKEWIITIHLLGKHGSGKKFPPFGTKYIK